MISKTGKPLSQKLKIVAYGRCSDNSPEIQVKTAKKFHGEISRDAQGNVDLVAEMAKHPDFLWVKVKAIEADEPNDNGDLFSREEIVKSYKTFEGCPVFTNHENQKVEAAKGKVVLAEWANEDNSVYCTMFIDREAYPALCRSIEEGIVTDVSMGTQVDYSTCSICENKSYTADSYCDHIKTMKGRTLNGKRVFERNYGLKFIELSVVTDGACKNCVIREVLDPEELLRQGQGQLARAAAEVKEMVKTGVMEKDAGQEEIQKLNDAMGLIEQVMRTMLDQRQYIDLEFASKVMEVLADLQHVNDELVDQGYASVGNPQQGQPEMAVPQMPENMQMGKEQPAEGPKPTITGPVPTGVGKVTEPSTAASDAKAVLSTRIANMKDLTDKLSKLYDEKKLSASGGDEVNKEEKFQETIRKLARVWENPSVRDYRAEIKEGDFKIVVGSQEIIGLRGGEKIASLKIADMDADCKEAIEADTRKVAGFLLDALKTKFAEAAPTNTAEQIQETMEAQLESQKPPLHPREKDIRQEITEKQLGEKREGYDQHARRDDSRQEITEAQLNKGGYESGDQFKRQNEPRDETMELQLRNEKWKGNSTPADKGPHAAGVKDQAQQIHEGQLEEWRSSDKAHKPEDRITEKQLEKDIGEPWGRRIACIEDAKLALAAGMKTLVRTALATGATPDELISTIGSLSDTPKTLVASADKIDQLADGKSKESRQDLLKRASFHGKLVVASRQDVTDYLMGSVADAGMCGEVGMDILQTLASQKDAFNKIAKAIEAGLEEPKVVQVANRKQILMAALEDEQDKTESVKVLLSSSQIKPTETPEAFAEAAYEAATKVAETQGLKVTGKVHVAKKDDGTVEVALTGIREAKAEKKEEKSASDDLAQRKEARKKLVEAQTPAGGGTPGTMGPGAGSPAGMGGGGTTMPAMPTDPTAGPQVGAFGAPPEEPPMGEEEDTGEAMPPGSICPACGSDDVDVRKGEFNCNNCGGTGHITVRLDMDNWPGTIQEKTPEKGEGEMGGMAEEPGMGMGGEESEGMEVPPVGVAASFKVTPEMVKVAGNKPIGSYCPKCGSSKVKLAKAEEATACHCESCKKDYTVESFVDQDSNELWARVEWQEPAPKAAKSNVETKRASLENALKGKGWTAKFAGADLKGKADIIAILHDEKLLG